jgi:hypothetical protein
VHITTDNDQMDEVAQTMSRTTHKSAYTAMDYALKAQEINTKLLQQTTQAWIEASAIRRSSPRGWSRYFSGSGRMRWRACRARRL